MAEKALSVIVELRGQGITLMLVEPNVQNALSVADPAYVFASGPLSRRPSVTRQLCAPLKTKIDQAFDRVEVYRCKEPFCMRDIFKMVPPYR
jgi:hypothetical protein